MSYCPFFSLSHDTMDCIVTQGAGACCRGGGGGGGHDTARRPCDTAPRHGWPARKGMQQRARATLSGVSCDTMICIVAGGGLCVAIQSTIQAAIRRSSALRHSARALRHAVD